MAAADEEGLHAMTTVQGRPTESRSTSVPAYYVNFWVDAMFLGGFSILFFLYLRFGIAFLGHNDGAGTATFLGMSASRWAFLAFWVLNWPHFAATSYRLYRSKETTSQYPITAWVVPVIVGVGAVLSLMSPEGVAPWFVKAFFVWSPYHFSGQTIGLTMLYARRAGFEVTSFMRWAVTWFVYANCLEFQARAELPGTTVTFGDVVMPSMGIPEWTVDVAGVGVAVMGLLATAACIDAARRSSRGFPPILAVPALAQLTWFGLSVGPFETPSYFEFVNLFHSVQYLFIAWFMQMRERQIISGREGSLSILARETAIWGVGIFVIGVFMFRGSGFLVSTLFGVSSALAVTVMTATFQLHHFFVDGVIWKLRNPTVRGALNTSIGELTGRAGKVG